MSNQQRDPAPFWFPLQVTAEGEQPKSEIQLPYHHKDKPALILLAKLFILNQVK